MWYGQYYVYGIYTFASRPAAVDVHALLLQVKILESDPPEVTAALPCIGPERQVSGTRTSQEECWQDRATGVHSGE